MLSKSSVILKPNVSLYKQSEEKEEFFKPISSIKEFLSQSTSLADCKDRQATLNLLLESIQGVASENSSIIDFAQVKKYGGSDVEAVRGYLKNLKEKSELIQGLKKLEKNKKFNWFNTSSPNPIDDLKNDINTYIFNGKLDPTSKGETVHPLSTIINSNPPGATDTKHVDTALDTSAVKKETANKDFDKQAFKNYMQGKVSICDEAHDYTSPSDSTKAIGKDSAKEDLISRYNRSEIKDKKTWLLQNSEFPDLLKVTYLDKSNGLIIAKEAYLAFIQDNKTKRYYWKFVKNPKNYSPEKHQTIAKNKNIRFEDMKVISQLLQEALEQEFRVDKFYAPESKPITICTFKSSQSAGKFISTLEDGKNWLVRKSINETGVYVVSYINNGRISDYMVGYVTKKNKNNIDQSRWEYLGLGSIAANDLSPDSQLCFKEHIYKLDIEEIISVLNSLNTFLKNNKLLKFDTLYIPDKEFVWTEELYIPNKGSELARGEDYDRADFVSYMEGKIPVCTSEYSLKEISKASKTWYLKEHQDKRLKNVLVIMKSLDNILDYELAIAYIPESGKWEMCNSRPIQSDIIDKNIITQKGRLDFADMSAMVSMVDHCLGRELRLEDFYAPRKDDPIAAKDYKVFGAEK